MNSDAIIGILIRMIPALVVAGLAFFAASDRKTRERWGDLLYQVGSIRPDQRTDPKVGSGVKWPFFIVAFLLLIWPLQHFLHVSRRIEVGNSDLHQKTEAPTSDLMQKSGAAPDATANSTANSTAATPNTTTDVASTPPPPQSDLRSAPPAAAPATGAPQSDLYAPAPAPR